MTFGVHSATSAGKGELRNAAASQAYCWATSTSDSAVPNAVTVTLESSSLTSTCVPSENVAADWSEGPLGEREKDPVTEV